MGYRQNRTGKCWVVVLLVAVAAAALALTAGPSAEAGKPSKPPPPSDKTVYFHPVGTSWWTMATDGSGKSSWGTVPQKCPRVWSDAAYEGYVWGLIWDYAASGEHPDGESLTEIFVSPVTPGGTATKILSSSSFKPLGVAFRPGSSLRVTFDGVHWYTDAVGNPKVECGLFEIALTLATDGSISHIGTPTTLFAVDNDYWTDSDSGYMYGNTMFHDWISSTRVAYGWKSQIIVRDIPEEDPAGGDYWSLIPSGSPLMSGLPHYLRASPDGTRVAYRTWDGIYEVATSGSGTPVEFVTEQRNTMTGDFEYEDDDTLVFGWQTLQKGSGLWAHDVCRQVRGESRVNLTGDTSTNCVFVNVR